ncbi:hypothetical protein ANN_12767 [Periplaneta americana]|uniref:Tc1-like transposase DDE domain-containing protein n=1 Tax=Periplaneta americana TaxID=6978 RepID=A0ABQ8TJQ4_PERAM|nr:hypothetical protein ANN_12767 [Periplaneta americana]
MLQRATSNILYESYNGWGDHRANHTLPPFWLDDRPPLLRHVGVRPPADWSNNDELEELFPTQQRGDVRWKMVIPTPGIFNQDGSANIADDIDKERKRIHLSPVKEKARILFFLFNSFRLTLGLMHHEFIPEGRTVTKELYVETLRRLWDAVRRKRPEKWVENNWFLMHDNAPAHRAIIVKNFLARHNITALDHPPYSPDLSPPDYFLFPRLKSHLKGRRFNAEEVIANATRALRRVSQNGFQACFQELYTRWQKCVVAEGNYFEGNAVE